MYFFTHLFLSKTLSKHFLERIILDKKAFAYGNVKPDIHRPKPPLSHTLENYLFPVSKLSQELMEKDIPLKEFSEKLGEVCHHLCDFFCYYHLNEEIYNKKLSHFMYELLLHYDFYRLYLTRQLKFTSSKREPNKNIMAIVLEMRKEYFSQAPSYKRDITYAINTSIWVYESILYYRNYPAISKGEATLKTFPLRSVEGGRL